MQAADQKPTKQKTFSLGVDNSRHTGVPLPARKQGGVNHGFDHSIFSMWERRKNRHFGPDQHSNRI